ncbi:MAG: Rab family GTPase [Candidatus Hodarchaeota archaeon]
MSLGYVYSWKIVVGGAGGAGKTTLLMRFIENKFIEDTKITIGVKFHMKKVTRQDTTVALLLWDLGGQKQFRFVQGSYIKGASAALIFFDTNRPQTLKQVPKWVELVRANTKGDIPILFIGNKLDLISEQKREMVRENAEQMVKELGMNCYIGTSAKDNLLVEETFNYLVDLLLWKAAQKKEELLKGKS